MATNLYKVFSDDAYPTSSSMHHHIEALHNDPIRRKQQVSDNLPRLVSTELDEHDIENPLSREETRILFKILRKDLPDCGRKRGAILRYIKAYMPERERNLSIAMYNHIKHS